MSLLTFIQYTINMHFGRVRCRVHALTVHLIGVFCLQIDKKGTKSTERLII